MTKYVIQRKSDGKFMKGGRGYTDIQWVNSIQDARIYGRQCDLSNSIREHFGNRRTSWQSRQEFAANYKAVPVAILQLETGLLEMR